jgi:hypothetical protein
MTLSPFVAASLSVTPAATNRVHAMELDGLREFRAAIVLLDREGISAAQLNDAAQLVWAAMFHRPLWPSELQHHAQALEPTLFKYGTIKMTVDRMSAPELESMRQELAAFIIAAEKLLVRRP